MGIIAAVVALATFASLGRTTAYGQEADVSREQAIERLLEQRAKGLVARDRDLFLSTIYPRSRAFFRSQASLFDRLGGVPLGDFHSSADWEAFGDLARPSDVAAYPSADEVLIPLTVERYRLRGSDTEAVIQDAYLTFVRDGDEWFVAADDDLADVGIETQKNPWDLDEVALSEGGRLLAVSSGCGGAPCPGVDQLLEVGDAALERVNEYWDRSWNRDVPFFAPGDPSDLAQIIQATFPIENYVAFAFWTGGEGDSEGARIIASPDAFAGASSERNFSVLAHELTHVATLPYRGGFMPRFLDEGFAQYVQYDAAGRAPTVFDAAVVASGDIELPADYEFFVGDGTDVQLAYQKSLSAISFLAERWGDDAVRRLYRKIGSASSLDGTSAHHVDEAFRKVVGMDLDRFQEAWASSIAL